jgi:hypothetical protein
MADVEWGEEQETPRKKKGIPGWVWWGCGGGCLVVTLIAVAVVVAGTFFFRGAIDPEKQWPRLAEVLAYDQRPEHLSLEFGMGIGADQFHLVDHAAGLRAALIQYPSSASSEYKQTMDPDFGVMGLGKMVDARTGTLEIQRREVPFVRFERVKPEPEGAVGPGIRLDLTGETGKPRTLELRKLRVEPLGDEEVLAFLSCFDVWRGR